ncbi:thioredoxin-dependent thiol peroxidase [Arsenicicoccus sp. MKL-02]|uniref:thioredoxin-dependent peroxiredoxin n=1 Tax=Arsenicicoccus cauae TaxID=2663847 RepID=A0A6I3I549_9MICO|nr:thioredoxin-dependent thiol peroxidase [Arsenicicoccus cauae]MTB71294.1 thioredoxin-dependent thiol peroxidase [Arsenicicoccus cauae]
MPRLEPGDQAPDFTLPDDTGAPVSLADFRGRRLVIFFYPAAMTPGCTTEACDFRDSLGSLRAAGYEVVGISKDAPDKLARFREKEGLTYPLLGDPDLGVLTAFGAYGEKKSYGKTIQGVIRSTIVLDEQGRVELAKYNVKAKGHVASLSRSLGLAE